MTPKLSKELSDALDANERGPLQVVDPSTERTYFIVEGKTHRQAMQALQQQRRQDDHAAIAEGIAQMEAGEVISLDEARKQTEERLLSRQK